MRDEDLARAYTKAVHDSPLVGTNLYKMEKAANRALNRVKWLKESRTHANEAALTKYGTVIDTYSEALRSCAQSEEFGVMFDDIMTIQLYTRFVEESHLQTRLMPGSNSKQKEYQGIFSLVAHT